MQEKKNNPTKNEKKNLREREREPFLYRKNMHRMEEIEWQIYNKMMRIKKSQNKEDKMVK